MTLMAVVTITSDTTHAGALAQWSARHTGGTVRDLLGGELGNQLCLAQDDGV
jgi:hypothetical protein